MELSRRVLVCLHGFMGCGGDWQAFADAMEGWEVLAPDLPWHGEEFDDGAEPEEFGEELVRWLRERGIERAVLAGYSMGGRIGIRVAIQFPEVFPVFIGVSTTAGIEDQQARRERHGADSKIVGRLRGISEEGEFRRFLEDWWGMEVFGGGSRDGLEEFLESRLGHDPGRLAECLENWGSGCLEPVWGGLGDYPGSALFVSGALDLKYTEIARRMAAAVPLGDCTVVPAAGHRLPSECPRGLARVVSDWLAGGAGVAFPP